MPVGLILGIVAVHGLGWRPIVAVAGTSAAALLLAAWRLSDRPTGRNLALLGGFVFLGAALSLAEIATTRTTVISGTATTRIAGRVVERSIDDRGRYRYLVDIAATARPLLSRPPERARILVNSRHEPFEPGEAFYGLVRLGPPSGPAYPGGYDFAFSPFFDGLGAYGFSLGAPTRAPPEGLEMPQPDQGPGTITVFLAQLREAMTDRIRAVIPGPEGAVAAALITGERQGIPEEVETWFRSTGIAHVLSISGLHLAIVAGAVMVLVRSLLALSPAIALRSQAKKWAAGCALAIAALYLGLSGANVATQRAFVMLAIMLAAVIFDRPALTIRNVSIAATLIILTAPHVVMTASFQMSFAATAALVGAYRALSEAGRQRRERRDRRWAKRGPWVHALLAVGGILMTSLVAGAATAPFSAYHFHQVAAFGLIANLLTMPLFSFVIMPLALIGSLLMPFGLDALCLQPMGIALGIVLDITEWLAGIVPDQKIGLVTGIGLALLAAAILAVTLLASWLRLTALPLAAAGLFLAPNRTPPPDLLIFESGKEVATIEADGTIAFLRKRPNDFVAEQWERAYAASSDPPPQSGRIRIAPACDAHLCSFTTPAGLKVVWTDDYRQTGYACDHADVAIVARAIRLAACRSGAKLVTLRTLRVSGSLAIRRDPATGRPAVTYAIAEPPAPWNRHRLAPWPESWRKPKPGAQSQATDSAAPAGAATAVPTSPRGRAPHAGPARSDQPAARPGSGSTPEAEAGEDQ
nr:ComEC/Rec2 family competence protein [Aurantimonas sp. VKM B-3413]